MPDDRYRSAAEAAIEEVHALEAQLGERKRFANILAKAAGIDPPPFDETTEVGEVSVGIPIKPDDFADYLAPSVAARQYLTMRGKDRGAASLDQIMAALQKGGFKFGSSKNEASGGIRIALAKDVKVHKMDNDHYGLLEWYPAQKRSKERRRSGQADDVDTSDEDAASPVPPSVNGEANEEEAK
jgi:hypothetical protein